ncbi:NusA-like transcription termination signal-binding factor [Haloarchaeobius iranensis]|uniref:Probable transcription termination protein NusA n=1 Tax=Haloarchaeobius iranensis TaxID=996166 RepID=A0A1G9XMF3_9EURY|nr:NusA-like transcription termination signal-binding factor [Haloarchaeobius iranensis]SDM97954.1 N utilization substance protein A [Haloarchaeobius iranensis]
MAVTLTDEALRILGLFEEVTEASGRDCLVEDDRVVVLVAAGDMGPAIGPAGQHVAEFEERLGRDVKLVEDADTAADFVANALAPAAVYHVTISENGDTVAYAEVDEADTGVAIGSDGRNIDTARELAKRHFDVDDIQLA